jgi:hypothetical protein
MTIEELRKFRQAQPSRPFTIYLADGRSLRVDHPENIASSPNGRTIAVYADGDEGAESVDLLLVTSLKASPRRTRSNGHR